MRLLVIILNLLFTILILEIPTLAKNGTVLNPFLPYNYLLSSEHTRTAIENGEFSCILMFMEGRKKCSFYPKDGVFSEISVSVLRDVPDTISFHIIENALQVGDLALLWGKPDNMFPHSAPTIMWLGEHEIIATVFALSVDRLNYFMSVQVVSFSF